MSAPPPFDYIDSIKFWTVNDLRLELDRLHQPTAGSKMEIVERLQQYYRNRRPPNLTTFASDAESSAHERNQRSTATGTDNFNLNLLAAAANTQQDMNQQNYNTNPLVEIHDTPRLPQVLSQHNPIPHTHVQPTYFSQAIVTGYNPLPPAGFSNQRGVLSQNQPNYSQPSLILAQTLPQCGQVLQPTFTHTDHNVVGVTTPGGTPPHHRFMPTHSYQPTTLPTNPVAASASIHDALGFGRHYAYSPSHVGVDQTTPNPFCTQIHVGGGYRQTAKSSIAVCGQNETTPNPFIGSTDANLLRYHGRTTINQSSPNPFAGDYVGYQQYSEPTAHRQCHTSPNPFITTESAYQQPIKPAATHVPTTPNLVNIPSGGLSYQTPDAARQGVVVSHSEPNMQAVHGHTPLDLSRPAHVQMQATSSNHLQVPSTAVPNMASTRVDQAGFEAESELHSLETKLQILKTKDQIRDYEYRLTLPPERLHCSAMNNASASDLNTSMLQLVKQSVDLNSLPPTKPFKFSGDAIEYTRWKTLFDLMVESKDLLPHQKLIYLEDFLTGEPLDAIKGYQSLNTEEAYRQARQKLDDRYGDPLDIKQAYRRRLQGWKKIGDHDRKELQRYSDFLSQCLITMSTLPALANSLNDEENMMKFPEVLPEYLIHKWSTKAGDMRFYEKRHATFKEYSQFVERAAFLANCKTTSVAALTGKDDIKSSRHGPAKSSSTFCSITGKDVEASHSEHHATSFATEVSTAVNKKAGKFCRNCQIKDSHDTRDCFKLGKLTSQEQQEFIKKHSLCGRCLESGHGKPKCPNQPVCVLNRCGGTHATVYHNKISGESSSSRNATAQHNVQTTEAVSHALHVSTTPDLTTMILPVLISAPEAPEHEQLVYALVDSMSDTSFISDEAAASLHMASTPAKLRLTTMTSQNEIVECRKFNHIRVRGLNSKQAINIPTTYSQPCVPGNRSHIPTPDTARPWKHLENIADKIAPLQDCEISLLIGFNCPAASCSLSTVRGGELEPYGVQTVLGWSVIGGLVAGSDQLHVSHRISSEELVPLEILKYLEEDLRVDHSSKSMSQDDYWFLKYMNESVTINEGHYTMPLPLKSPPEIPDNRSYAMKRFRGLERKLQSDPLLNSKYREFMAEIISKNEAQVCTTTEPGWYIPHHGVFNPHKPGKLRVVFDCSASFKGHSLNKLLCQGPDLNNSLAGLLCRFRKDRVAVTCDVKSMFHQFRVSEEHRKFLRFLWYKEGTSEIIDHQMNVHLFGATSSPSCAIFGLQRLASDHAADLPDAADFIRGNFYVDDGLISLPTADDAIMLMKDTLELTKRGNLTLHKFLSNDTKVAQALNCDGPAIKDLGADSTSTPMSRTLGLAWDVIDDSFKFRSDLEPKPWTRRGILSTVASIFDPLGLLTPFTLQGKLILQKICSDGKSWDENLEPDQMSLWKEWIGCLPDLTALQFPRCWLGTVDSASCDTELHVFSDASSYAYGVCAYVRVRDPSSAQTSLVMGKSRVAPRKATTIPRLELQAATLAVKVGDFLQQELRYQNMKVFYWTDSETVLGYISNETKRFHVFVANRVQRIKDTSEQKQWHHISSLDNPADIASRGSSVKHLPSMWFTGPGFLQDAEFEVPEVETPQHQLHPDDPEIRRVFTHMALTDTNQLEHLKEFISIFDRCSSWQQVSRLVSCFIKMMKPLNRYNDANSGKAVLTIITRLLQRYYLSNERDMLLQGKTVSKNSQLFRLDPFLDSEGVIRVGGRIKDDLVCEEVRHPIVMPGRSHLARLFCRYVHSEAGHQGKATTLNHIRSRGVFLYSQGSKLISSVIKLCSVCTRLRGAPLGQKMADLPRERIEDCPPFTHCGMDVFGPYICKDGRKENKRYGLIFCCLASRAVHLEVLDDLTTDCFINSFRCFTSIRGPVSTMMSDQGTNFVGAWNELTKLATDHMQDLGCTFKFNTPNSSHMGGSWERLIRSVREVMTGILLEKNTSRLDTQGLRVLLYECMSMINSRPLTPISLSESSVDVLPLCPNMLLTMKPSTPAPPGHFSDPDLYSRKRWRRIQHVAELFWSRWRVEYLHSLQHRQKWSQKKRNLIPGDIVLLVDDNAPRSSWKMARVSGTQVSRDGLVRKVRLFLGPGKELDRPVHKLVLLIPSSSGLVN